MSTAATSPRGAFSWNIAIPALAILGASVFWIVAVTPYFTTQREAFGPAPDLYWDRRYTLWFHILGGTLALFTGPFQLWLGETRRRMPLHRALGVVYLAGVAITCSAGLGMSIATPVGFMFGAGLFSLSSICILATAMAYIAIKKRNFVQHREWMIRSYVLIFGFVFFRVGEAALLGMGVGGTGVEGDIVRLSVASWLCWAVPLPVTELFLQYPKLGRSGSS